MEITDLYKGLADENRLRILNLLSQGPLCGCHFVEALGMDQVKVSKQLNYMKRLGFLAAEREANWMIYRLAEPMHPLLMENLEGIKRVAEKPLPLLPLRADDAKLAGIRRRIAEQGDSCPQSIVQSACNVACCAPGS